MHEIMTVMLIVLIILAFLNVIIGQSIFQKYRYLYYIVIFVLVLMIAFRGDTADTSAYIQIFNYSPSVFDVDEGYFDDLREENGYLLLNVLARSISDDYIVLFLITGAISMMLYSKSIRDFARYPMMSLLLYYVMIYMTKEMVQVRRGVAMAIFVFSIRFLIRDEFFKFASMIGFASLFHQSVVVSILLYPFRHLKVNKYGVGCIVGVIAVFMLVDIIDPILLYFFSDAEFMKRIMVYMGTEFTLNKDMQRFYLYLFLFVLLGGLNVYLRNCVKYYDVWMLSLGLGLIFMSVWHEYPFFGNGFSAPLFVSIIFLLPGLLDVSKNVFYKFVIMSFLIALSIKVFNSNLMFFP